MENEDKLVTGLAVRFVIILLVMIALAMIVGPIVAQSQANPTPTPAQGSAPSGQIAQAGYALFEGRVATRAPAPSYKL